MTRGENIFRRKDGRWEARYVKGHDSSGKIKYGFCYGKTYKEAKEKVSQMIKAMQEEELVLIKRADHCFSHYCDEWLESKKIKLKESTFVKYHIILETHIKRKFGALFPHEINNYVIEAFADELLYVKKLAPKTVKDILVVFRSVIKFCNKNYPGEVPMIDFVYPKETRREMRVLTREEQSRFINYLIQDMDTCKFGVLLALVTGMRVGEICALRWDAISMEEKTIRVTSTMQRLKDTEENSDKRTKIVVGPPKSDTSLRTIPMTAFAAELCEKMNPQCEHVYILTGTELYMEPRTLQYRLARYVKECNLEDVHFHTLRHTFATRCIEVGFEIKSLSEILGHATTTITLNRYVHSSLELKRNNMNKLVEIGL